LVPVIVTGVPTGPDPGEKVVIVGGGVGDVPIVKLLALVIVVPIQVSLMEPVVALGGTTAVT